MACDEGDFLSSKTKICLLAAFRSISINQLHFVPIKLSCQVTLLVEVHFQDLVDKLLDTSLQQMRGRPNGLHVFNHGYGVKFRGKPGGLICSPAFSLLCESPTSSNSPGNHGHAFQNGGVQKFLGVPP